MKFRLRKIAVIVSLLFVCLFSFTGCRNSHIIDSLKRHSIDTNLLNDYDIVCDLKGETFTGRANSYGVLVFENEPTNFLQSFSTGKSDGFSSDKNEEFEHLIDTSFSDLEIPSEYCPNWDEEYRWYVSGGFDKIYYADTLFMIYFPNDLKLFVCETGH